MKLSEFILLNEDDKKSAVMKNAVALAQRTYPDLVIFLFQLDNFYIELSLLTAFPELVVFIAFVDGARLIPYLERIDISELY